MVAVGCFTMSSCSVYNKLLGKEKQDEPVAQNPASTPVMPVPGGHEAIPIPTVKVPVVVEGVELDGSHKTEQVKSESPVEAKNESKSKAEKASGKPAVKSTQSASRKPDADELCGGQWLVASVGDYTIEEEENGPYINFDNSGRYYASDGCNVLNGDYVLRSDGVMTFDNSISTMRLCPDVEYAHLITPLFSGAMRFSVDCKRIGQDTYLYLKDENGKLVATLRRHNMEFLNGQWNITSIEGQKIDDEEANIFIDIAELKMHGNTGCNSVNGKLYINPMRSNSINFSDMAVTFMLCHKGDQERRMLVALEQTETAISGKNDDTVIFLDKDGKELLTLKRVELKK